MGRSKEPLSALSLGLQMASRVTTVGVEFVLPLLAGVWLDRRFGTMPLATLLGAALGFVTAIVHLTRMSRERPEA